jgi:phosphoribosylamine-glycine ligase
MDKIGVLLVSYGAREVAMADALLRSKNHKVELYVADKQRNPYNAKHAIKHIVIPSLDIGEIAKFAQANKEHLDFVLVGSENPIIKGIRDLIEETVGIPVICPKKAYAIEESKVAQRVLFEEIAPEANPRFKVFEPSDYKGKDVKSAVYKWLNELDNQAVVKPDKPALGKGVGVWGDHFANREQLFEHFMSNFQYGAVLIEEKCLAKNPVAWVSATANTSFHCPTRGTTNVPSTVTVAQTLAVWAPTKIWLTTCPS